MTETTSEPNSRFVYVTYIRTTPERLWAALRLPEFTRQYWCGTTQACDWHAGSPWKLMIPDGRVGDSGEVLEIDPPQRLVLSWRNEFLPEMHADGVSRCTFTLEPAAEMVKLTVVHESDHAESTLVANVSTGWPIILSSLKSLLETGESIESTREWPKGF